jgi:DNA-binding transcriptional ArsR family regulator
MTDPQLRYAPDVASLKALAHPLRVRLLGALREYGPATASELGRRLGESSGSTSYHLRQLERFGFVAESAEQPNARDRRWQALHRYTDWSALESDPGGAETVRWLRERQRAHATRVAEEYEPDTWPETWRGIAGQSDLLLRLTPASVATLAERFIELAEEFAARDAQAADAASVDLFVATFPVREGDPR